MMRRLAVVLTGAAVLLLHSPGALALPTMIRLGYIECASCHYAPQGGGPLNPYGRTIDEGQSLRAGEYRPRDNKIVRMLSWDGRIAQDVRVVFPMQRAWAAHETSASFRPRIFYRNVTELARGLGVQLTFSGETEAVPRPAVSYDPNPGTASPVVNVALLRYRFSPELEISAGRDQLPSGLQLSDPGAFIKQRNRAGIYDAPAHVKVHWAGRRHRILPFAYAPGGNEVAGERESGGGAVAEIDPFGTHSAVLGVNLLHGSSPNGSRRMLGAHARLGFGAWGVLAEHDITTRTREDSQTSFRQHTTYGQAFWAAREWLVASAIVERLSVQPPFEERLDSGRFELAARLTSVASVSASVGVQRNELTRRRSRTFVVQFALKTVY